MKIFTASQIREHDKYTIEHEPITSLDLMERAAQALTAAITDYFDSDTEVTVFAGPGNNGGDALAVARLLADKGYVVTAYLFNVGGQLSADCEANRERLKEDKRVKAFVEVTLNFDPPQLAEGSLVIDGLFGSGLNKPLTGGFSSLVRYINQTPTIVVSIDMPSGLMPENNSFNSRSSIINADITLTLQHKKVAMMLADNQRHIGQLRILDIGLSKAFEEAAATRYSTIEEEMVREYLPKRDDFANKGTMGTAMIVAGSTGMAGAAILATRACLRSGAGKVIAVTPSMNRTILQVAVPEAIVMSGGHDDHFTDSVNAESVDALAIGPGIGTGESTATALMTQLRRTQCPVVADADALTILGRRRAWMQQMPPGMILTPHPKELDRLASSSHADDYERLEKASKMSQEFASYIILKGHYSALCMPDGTILFNTTGNSGMATAGSGDVLTGIITGLLARGCERHKACIVAMYIHGLAGDIAAATMGKESLVASDIIRYLPEAFKRLSETESA